MSQHISTATCQIIFCSSTPIISCHQLVTLPTAAFNLFHQHLKSVKGCHHHLVMFSMLFMSSRASILGKISCQVQAISCFFTVQLNSVYYSMIWQSSNSLIKSFSCRCHCPKHSLNKSSRSFTKHHCCSYLQVSEHLCHVNTVWLLRDAVVLMP